jgi:hypothetical protein
MGRDWRDDRIKELERENAALHAQNCDLQAAVEARTQTIAALEARIQHSEQRTGGATRQVLGQLVAPTLHGPAGLPAAGPAEANGPQARRTTGA